MSRSTKRRRSVLIPGLWATPEEAAAIRQKAQDTGVAVSEFQRVALLGHKPPPGKVDKKLMADVLYALGKIGTNINQIAFHLNAGRPGDRVEGSIEAAINDLLEMRSALMQAMGAERKPRGPEES